MSTRVLVVGCGFPQLGLLRFCKTEGLHVIGADANPTAVGVPLTDEFVHASTTDAGALARALRETGAAGVVTCGSEAALVPVSLAAREVGLPFYASPEVLEGFRMKHEMRRRYAEGGAPTPAYASARSLIEAQAFARQHPLPLVVKPARGWGQRGVRVVTTALELESAVTDALAVAGQAAGSDGAVCVIEEFIEGREFSVNAYTEGDHTEVLAITERIITSYPDPPGITFAEVFPPSVSSAEASRLAEAAAAGARALGVTRGPTYTQLRSGPRGAYLVETAHRLGGGLDPDVTLLASGVSLYRKIVGVALGRREWERAGVEAPRHGGATGRFLVAQPGRVTAITGLDAARTMPGVVDAQLYVGVGDTVHPLTDGSRRAGHVLATGADREQAEARAQAALATLHLAV